MATEEIKVVITAPGIDLRNLKDGGIILARVNERHPVGEMIRVRDAVSEALQRVGLQNTQVLLCAPDQQIEAMDEGVMNRLGWFRQPPDFNSPEIVEMVVREDGKVAWVNVNGKCALRASEIKNLVLMDQRDTAKQD